MRRLLATTAAVLAGSITAAQAGTLTLHQIIDQSDVFRVTDLHADLLGSADRIFIAEQIGFDRENAAIRIFDRTTGQFLEENFLTVSLGEDVPFNNGIQSFTPHPEYETNGLVYVSYADADSTHHVVEYRVTNPASDLSVDPNSARTILSIPRPSDSERAGHYGAWVGFSPDDGHLYVTVGDREVPLDNGTLQNPAESLFGSVLRIDPLADDFPDDDDRNYAIPSDNPFVGGEGRDEIWAYGLRNPFTAHFTDDGTLVIGDVGESAFEELNIGQSAANYGWPFTEGFNETGLGIPASDIGTLTDPFYAYAHGFGEFEGFAVIAGTEFSGIDGNIPNDFFFADFTGSIFSIDLNDPTDVTSWALEYTDGSRELRDIVALALGADGTLYITDNFGRVFAVVGVTPVPIPALGGLFLVSGIGFRAWRRARSQRAAS